MDRGRLRFSLALALFAGWVVGAGRDGLAFRRSAPPPPSLSRRSLNDPDPPRSARIDRKARDRWPWAWTPDRRDDPELMDAPGLPEDEVEDAYRVLRLRQQATRQSSHHPPGIPPVRPRRRPRSSRDHRARRRFGIRGHPRGHPGDAPRSSRPGAGPGPRPHGRGLGPSAILERGPRGCAPAPVRRSVDRPRHRREVRPPLPAAFGSSNCSARWLGSPAFASSILDIRRHWIAYWGFLAWSRVFTTQSPGPPRRAAFRPPRFPTRGDAGGGGEARRLRLDRPLVPGIPGRPRGASRRSLTRSKLRSVLEGLGSLSQFPIEAGQIGEPIVGVQATRVREDPELRVRRSSPAGVRSRREAGRRPIDRR